MCPACAYRQICSCITGLMKGLIVCSCFSLSSHMWLPHDQNCTAWLKRKAKLWKKSHSCLCTNKGQLISKHQKSPIYRLCSHHSNLIKPAAILCFLSFFFCFFFKEKATRSISLRTVCLFKKKKKKQPALFSLVSEFKTLHQFSLHGGQRLHCQREV